MRGNRGGIMGWSGTARTMFVLFILLWPKTVFANGGPLHDPADAYGRLTFDEQSGIMLVRERVSFRIGDGVGDDASGHKGAAVSVEYELWNPGGVDRQVDVLFLVPSREQVTVTTGGVRLDTGTPGVIPANWSAGKSASVVDPLSGKALRFSARGSQTEEAAGTQFALTFAAGEKKLVSIRYMDRGGFYTRGVVRQLYAHLYYLTPAKYWEGAPQVELELTFASPCARVYSNMTLERLDAYTYRGTLKELPDEEWSFSYMYPHRLLFPTNVERDHNLLVLGTAAAAAALAALAALWTRRSYIFLLASLGIMAFTGYYISRMGGYPFNTIFVGLTDTTVGIALLVSYAAIRRRIQRTR